MTFAYWLYIAMFKVSSKYKCTSGEEVWCNWLGFMICATITSDIKKGQWCEKLKYDFVTLGLLIS